MAVLSNAAAAFIGASVTLVLVIIFMILMVILVRQCLAFVGKRNSIRAQTEQQLRARAEFERQRRGSITEPVPATFDWHHSIRIAGTPPPTYHEAKVLPTFDDAASKRKKRWGKKERDRDAPDHPQLRTVSCPPRDETSNDWAEQGDNRRRNNTAPSQSRADLLGEREEEEEEDGSVPVVVAIANERNHQLMTSDLHTSVAITHEGLESSMESGGHIQAELEREQ